MSATPLSFQEGGRRGQRDEHLLTSLFEEKGEGVTQ